MRILLITPLFSPLSDPRSHRWSSIAEYWEKQGHEVVCITEKIKNKPSFSTENGIQIHRVGIGLPGLIEAFSKKNNGTKNDKPTSSFNLKHYLQKVFLLFVFPDFSFMWYPFAVRKTRQILQEEKFDLLITSALPFTSHLVGLYAKKRYPNLKWIGDWGDPFTFQKIYPVNNHFLYGKLNRRLEYRVFQKISAAVMTNRGAKKLYSDNFPDQADKIHIIPPLFNGKILELNIENGEGKKGLINFGYFGIFYKKNREPGPVLHAFSELIQRNTSLKNFIRINIYGKNFERFQSDFDRFPNLIDVIFFKGLIPKSKVAEEMAKQQFLINIGNLSNFQLPSKAPEYMATGKPIINFTSIKEDTFAAFCEEYPLLLNLLEGEGTVVQRLEEFVIENNGAQLLKEESERHVQNTRTNVVASAYLSLID